MTSPPAAPLPPPRPSPVQMTTMLDLLSSFLEAKEVEHCRIDGALGLPCLLGCAP